MISEWQESVGIFRRFHTGGSVPPLRAQAAGLITWLLDSEEVAGSSQPVGSNWGRRAKDWSEGLITSKIATPAAPPRRLPPLKARFAHPASNVSKRPPRNGAESASVGILRDSRGMPPDPPHGAVSPLV